MKKTLLIFAALIVLLASCDRKAFVKKLVGDYTMDKYLFDGLDKSRYFDTTFREWKLSLTEDQVYAKTWKTYFFSPDSLFTQDTLGYDTPNMVYIIHYDTLRFVDTTVTPHFEYGKWELINSEEDLQLKNDSANAVDIFKILELTKSNLDMRKGNEEYYLKK